MGTGCYGIGSKNRINERTIELLEKLAIQAQVPQFIEKMFRRASCGLCQGLRRVRAAFHLTVDGA